MDHGFGCCTAAWLRSAGLPWRGTGAVDRLALDFHGFGFGTSAMRRSARASVLLCLCLLGGPALAATPDSTPAAARGCPSDAAAEASGTAIPSTPPATPATPATQKSPGEAVIGEAAHPPRARSRVAAWHSFLPGMFK